MSNSYDLSQVPSTSQQTYDEEASKPLESSSSERHIKIHFSGAKPSIKGDLTSVSIRTDQTAQALMEKMGLIDHAMQSDKPTTIGQEYRHKIGTLIKGKDVTGVKVGTSAISTFEPLTRDHLKTIKSDSRLNILSSKYPKSWGVYQAVEKAVLRSLRTVLINHLKISSKNYLIKMTCVPASNVLDVSSLDFSKTTLTESGRTIDLIKKLPEIQIQGAGRSKSGHKADEGLEFLRKKTPTGEGFKVYLNEKFDFLECKDLRFGRWSSDNKDMVGKSDVLYMGEIDLKDKLMINLYEMLAPFGKLIFVETLTQKEVSEFEKMFNSLDAEEKASVTISPDRQMDFQHSFSHYPSVPQEHLGFLAKRVRDLESVGFEFKPFSIQCCNGSMYVYSLEKNAKSKELDLDSVSDTTADTNTPTASAESSDSPRTPRE